MLLLGKLAALPINREQHVECERLDGEGNRLCGKQRPQEAFEGNSVGVEGRANILATERREFERCRGLVPDPGQRGSKSIRRPNGSPTCDADRQAVGRDALQLRGEQIGDRIDAEQRFVEAVEVKNRWELPLFHAMNSSLSKTRR